MPPPAPQMQAPPVDRYISISLNEYLSRQNEIANSIRGYQQMATQLMSHVGQQASSAAQAMSLLQETTQSALLNNGLNPLDESLAVFPSIAALLKVDKADFSNPFAPGLNSMPGVSLPGIKLKKPKKPRKQKAPGAPKRPQTAFFLFQMGNRETYREQMKANNPDVKPGHVQKKLTETWNGMSPLEQQPYKAQYAQAVEKYGADKKAFEQGTAPSDAAPLTDRSAVPSAAAALAVDAEGDIESEDESSSSESEESERSPTPPPKKIAKDKAAKSKDPKSDKKKRKAEPEAINSVDEASKVTKSGKKSKKSEEKNIDPELRSVGKDKTKKPSGYAPATAQASQLQARQSQTYLNDAAMASRLSGFGGFNSTH